MFGKQAQINWKFLYSPNPVKENLRMRDLDMGRETHRSIPCRMGRLLALSLLFFIGTATLMAQPDLSTPPDSSEAEMGSSRGQEAELDTELARVQFKQGQVGLTAEAVRELDRVVVLMKAHPDLIVNVFGHADDTGTIYRMQELSELRAKMVKAYLISQGISLDRIYDIGFGFRRPSTFEVTPAGRAENRRVEVHIDYYNHK